METNKAFREMARKESRGYGVVGAGSAGVPRYPDYDVRMMTDEGYRKNIIVSACIQMIATSAPEAPLKIYKETASGLVEDESHWFNRLLKQPNDHQSPFELWELFHTYVNTGGATYLELVREGNRPDGEVLEMYPLRPDRIRIIPGVTEYIEAYEYWIDGQRIIYEPWEILPIKLPDPLDEFNALSPLKRVMRELGIDNEATDFTKTFFDNAAVPYGLLTTEQVIGENEADRIRWRWQKWFRGAKRFMVAVLGKGMKYERMGLSFDEMEFESLRSMTESRLCAAFGVDPVLLPSWVGIKHGGKYSNYAEARKHLWEETIIPMLRRTESKISTLLEDGVVAKFDLTEVQALQEDANEKAKRMGELFKSDLIMKNEGRIELGFDPVPDGDVFYSNSIKPESNPAPNSNNDPDDDPDNDDDQKSVKKKNLNLVIKDKKKQGKAMVELYDRLEGPTKKEFQKFFRKSKKDIMQLFEKKQVDPEYMEEFQRHVNELAEQWHDALTELSTVQIKAILEAGGSLAAGMMGLTFNGTSPEAVKYLEDYVPKFVQRFNETTKKDLQSTMIKAQVQGWGVPRLKDELKRVFNKYEYNRAEMVARSEVVRSSNAGATMAYKQADVLELEWLDTDDQRTCKFCKKLDGKKIGINGTFLNVGESVEVENEDGTISRYKNTYETIQYPPLHPNCRCTVIPVVD